MAASTIASIAKGRAAAPAPRALNVAVLIASVWFFAGLLLDGWAHSNLDLSKEGFFTPYHAVFYSGFFALSASLGIGAWRLHTPGTPWYSGLPQSYRSMGIGIAIFAVGGALDMLWHIKFGIEQDTQALFSPTHLLLAVGQATMMSGPIRAGLARPEDRTWAKRFPELLALAFLATLVTFFLMWAFGTGAGIANDPHRVYPSLTGDALSNMRDLQVQDGVTAVIFRSLVMAGIAGWAARRLRLPFGAVAFLVAIPNTLIALMLDPGAATVWLSLGSSLVAGFAGDLALHRWNRFDKPTWRSRTFGFALPFLFWAVYFSTAFFVSGGFWWSPHVAYGAPVIAGLTGLLLTLAGEARTT